MEDRGSWRNEMRTCPSFVDSCRKIDGPFAYNFSFLDSIRTFHCMSKQPLLSRCICSFPKVWLLFCAFSRTNNLEVTLHSLPVVRNTPGRYFCTRGQGRSCIHTCASQPMAALQHDVECPCQRQGGLLGPAASDVKGQPAPGRLRRH